jgi:hypothetical protein
MGEHKVGQGDNVERGALGVLGPGRGQRDGEGRMGNRGRAKDGAGDSGRGAWKHATR